MELREERKKFTRLKMWQITPHCAFPTCFSRSTNVYLCIQHLHKSEKQKFFFFFCWKWIEKWMKVPTWSFVIKFCAFFESETHGDVIWYPDKKSGYTMEHAFFVDISAHINFFPSLFSCSFGVKQQKNQFAFSSAFFCFKVKWMDLVYDTKAHKIKSETLKSNFYYNKLNAS